MSQKATDILVQHPPPPTDHLTCIFTDHSQDFSSSSCHASNHQAPTASGRVKPRSPPAAQQCQMRQMMHSAQRKIGTRISPNRQKNKGNVHHHHQHGKKRQKAVLINTRPQIFEKEQKITVILENMMQKLDSQQPSPEKDGSSKQKQDPKEYLNDLYHNTPQFDDIVPTFSLNTVNHWTRLMRAMFDPVKFSRYVDKFQDYKEVFDSKDELVKLTQIRKQKLMMDREAHFPMTFVKMDKEEIKRRDKEFDQLMQTFYKVREDLKKQEKEVAVHRFVLRRTSTRQFKQMVEKKSNNILKDVIENQIKESKFSESEISHMTSDQEDNDDTENSFNSVSLSPSGSPTNLSKSDQKSEQFENKILDLFNNKLVTKIKKETKKNLIFSNVKKQILTQMKDKKDKDMSSRTVTQADNTNSKKYNFRIIPVPEYKNILVQKPKKPTKMKFDGLGDIISICENHANSEIRPNRVKKNKLIFSTRSSNQSNYMNKTLDYMENQVPRRLSQIFVKREVDSSTREHSIIQHQVPEPRRLSQVEKPAPKYLQIYNRSRNKKITIKGNSQLLRRSFQATSEIDEKQSLDELKIKMRTINNQLANSVIYNQKILQEFEPDASTQLSSNYDKIVRRRKNQYHTAKNRQIQINQNLLSGEGEILVSNSIFESRVPKNLRIRTTYK